VRAHRLEVYTEPLSVIIILNCNTRGVKDNFRVNRNINYIFGILTSRAINWCINESILRGSEGGGGSGNFGGGLQKFAGPLSQNINHIFGNLSSSPVDWHPCWVV